ncbi:MAG: hypothetical protein CL908_12325 [Deltaproteobacteria bacterium]|nr:hypothetical protein [Deltaproteobacteria bacterium]
MGMRFGPPSTPPIMIRLMIVNAVIFLLVVLFPVIDEMAAVKPVLVWRHGYFWQPFTYMWLHASIGHIAINLFVLWMFGSELALEWGPKRFLQYYLVCGLGAGLLICTWPYLLVGMGVSTYLDVPTVGASGAVYGIVLAYSLTWPDRTVMLIFPPVAFRAIWVLPAMFVFTLVMGGGNVSHVGHLGGVIAGWIALRRSGVTGGLGAKKKEPLRIRWRRSRFGRSRKRRSRTRSGLRVVRPAEPSAPRDEDEHNAQ